MNVSPENQLMQQAIQLTSAIRANYPELCVFLDETPLFLSANSSNQTCISEFEKHFETLTAQLRNYIDAHPHIHAAI